MTGAASAFTPAAGAGLPALPLDAWHPTRDTLHLWCQVVGKVKLAATPGRNQWWNVPLLVDARGLTTGRLSTGGRGFEVALDLLAAQLVVRTDAPDERSFPLVDGLSVAAFDRQLHAALAELGVDVTIREEPFGTPVSDVPFPDDEAHATFDAAAAARFWRVLAWSNDVLGEFAGWFCGKQSPVHVFWHSFDLAHARFSGRVAPGMDTAEVDGVTREAYRDEVIAFGFWPGDAATGFPAFYSYTAPEPDGLTDGDLGPAGASWADAPGGGHLAVLAWEDVRTSADPRTTLLAFWEHAYQAGARAAAWDRADLRSSWCVAPVVLERFAAFA